MCVCVCSIIIIFKVHSNRKMAKSSLRIVFYTTELVGPQNACIGFAQTLNDRGHDVSFFTTTESMPKYRKFGFKCLELKNDDDEKSAPDDMDSVSKFVKKLAKYGFLSDLTPLKKLRALGRFFEETFADASRKFNSQIKQYLQNEHFDLIIIDCEIFPSSLIAVNRPWIYLFCSHPIGLFQSDKLPPFISDFATNSDPKTWEIFREELERIFYSIVRNEQRKLFEEFGLPSTKSDDQFIMLSPYLNLYQYPKELDYDDVIDIDRNRFFGVDTFCHFEMDKDGQQFEIPFRDRMKSDDKLVYLSLGSMGSGSVELMKRLVRILAKTKHWYLVSKGKLHDQYELAANMWGDIYVPQTRILSIVDAAILHGGNNGFTEALYHGKPVLIMPMFYDQYHNGVRVVEKKIGLTLNPFRFEDHELVEAIDRLLSDDQFRNRAEKIAKNISERRSKEEACKKIEKIVEEFVDSKQTK
ncbi:NDP-glycosyltransferase YjiC [Dermatophagoides farinae]